jgi:DNA-binding transcriptional ArsR family regulator
MLASMSRTTSDDSVFQAIASPTRRALLDALSDGERNVSELVGRLEITQSAVSQQLAILKSAGLVSERSDGRFRRYRLEAAPLREVVTWVGRYRALLERHLDALGSVLDAMPDLPSDQRLPIRKKGRSS